MRSVRREAEADFGKENEEREEEDVGELADRFDLGMGKPTTEGSGSRKR